MGVLTSGRHTDRGRACPTEGGVSAVVLYVCPFAQPCPTLCGPKGIFVCQAPLSMRFSRQEYWSGLPFPPPRGLPDARIESVSLTSPDLAGGFFSNAPLERSAHEYKPTLVADCLLSTVSKSHVQGIKQLSESVE